MHAAILKARIRHWPLFQQEGEQMKDQVTPLYMEVLHVFPKMETGAKVISVISLTGI